MRATHERGRRDAAKGATNPVQHSTRNVRYLVDTQGGCDPFRYTKQFVHSSAAWLNIATRMYRC